MTAQILDALKKLDPANDNHWTEDGAPRMDTVKMLAGNPGLTREAVTAAAPGFSRAVPLATETPPAETKPEDTVVTSQEPSNASVEGSAGAGEADSQVQSGDAKGEALARLKSAQAALVEATARKAEADQVHAAAIQALDEATDALTEAGGIETLADALNGYARSQAKIRAERADRLNALRGINLKDILPMRAPIDNAMSRKTQRGGQRPVVPVK